MAEKVHKFPGSLEAIAFRKGTQDWGISFAIPRESFSYAKPLGDKVNLYFIVAAVEVESQEQAETLLADQVEIPTTENDRNAGVNVVSTGELQEMFAENGVPMTRQHIAVLERSGYVHRISKGKYDRNSSVNGYVEYLRRQAHGMGSANYQEARAKDKMIQSEEREIKLAALKKKLCLVDTAKRGFSTYLIAVKSKLLTASTRADNVDAQEVIDGVVRECCADLERIDINRILADGCEQVMEVAGEAHDKPVGRKGKGAKSGIQRKSRKLAKR